MGYIQTTQKCITYVKILPVVFSEGLMNNLPDKFSLNHPAVMRKNYFDMPFFHKREIT